MLTKALRRERRAPVHPAAPAAGFPVAGEEPAAAQQDEANYRNLLLNGAWFGLIDGGIFTYLPVFLARLGASPSMIGLLTSGPALAGIISYIPGGAYAERKTNLVRLAVWSSFLVRLAYPLIALLPFLLPQQYVPLAAVLAFSVFTLPNGVYIPTWTTVMQQAVAPRRRAQLNGTRWALFSLVSGLAITIFGWALDRLPSPGGYQIVFMISFVAACANLYYFSKVRVPPFEKERTARESLGLGARLRHFFRPLAESKAFVRYNVATLPWRLASSLPMALFSIYWVDSLKATDTWIGLRGTAGYAALVVGYRLWGRTANRMGHRNLLLLCGVASGLYPILTGLAPSAPWLLPAAVVWGLTISGTDIGTFDMLLACCPPGRQPSFAATSNMLVSVGTFAGPLLGAGLARLIGVQHALFVCGSLQLLAAACFAILPGREQECLDAA